jgi:hypothetical protein
MSEVMHDIATEVIYEDDHVRVWKQVVPAGAHLAKHEHKHDYFLVNVAGEGPFDVKFHDSSGGKLGDRISYCPKPRTADFVAKGHIETAHNQGDEYRAILVELK